MDERSMIFGKPKHKGLRAARPFQVVLQSPARLFVPEQFQFAMLLRCRKCWALQIKKKWEVRRFWHFFQHLCCNKHRYWFPKCTAILLLQADLIHTYTVSTMTWRFSPAYGHWQHQNNMLRGPCVDSRQSEAQLGAILLRRALHGRPSVDCNL